MQDLQRKDMMKLDRIGDKKLDRIGDKKLDRIGNNHNHAAATEIKWSSHLLLPPES